MNASASRTPHYCVLLTGATGFLGAQIARHLLRCSTPAETDLTIITLVRAGNESAAAHRLSRAWWDWPETASAIGDNGLGLGQIAQVKCNGARQAE